MYGRDRYQLLNILVNLRPSSTPVLASFGGFRRIAYILFVMRRGRSGRTDELESR